MWTILGLFFIVHMFAFTMEGKLITSILTNILLDTHNYSTDLSIFVYIFPGKFSNAKYLIS